LGIRASASSSMVHGVTQISWGNPDSRVSQRRERVNTLLVKRASCLMVLAGIAHEVQRDAQNHVVQM
jgi:hypothetical protein